MTLCNQLAAGVRRRQQDDASVPIMSSVFSESWCATKNCPGS
jgi:hypothetical protein